MKVLSSTLLLLTVSSASAAEASKKAPPPFFIQDTKDSLCVAGEDFRRCSIDTLWYVVGSPGAFKSYTHTVIQLYSYTVQLNKLNEFQQLCIMFQ